MRSYTHTQICHSFPLIMSARSDSPLLPDRLEAGAWADHPAAPSGHTVPGWSPTRAPGSPHHVLAAVLLLSDLNRRGTRSRTATAAPEGALLRLSLGHCAPTHPGHRRKVLETRNSKDDFLVFFHLCIEGKKKPK